MDKKDETQYDPILPYDITFAEHFHLYDHMQYQRDLQLCNKETVRMQSGNVYKYYTLKEQEPKKVGGL